MAKVLQLLAEWNHSFNCIESGRHFQFKLDLHLPNKSKSEQARKCLSSETFSLLVVIAGKPPLLQNPMQKVESGLGKGRGSPKGKVLG